MTKLTQQEDEKNRKNINLIGQDRKEYLIRKHKIAKRHNKHCDISLEKLFDAIDNATLEEELKNARKKYIAEIKKWDALFGRRIQLLRQRYESYYWNWDFY